MDYNKRDLKRILISIHNAFEQCDGFASNINLANFVEVLFLSFLIRNSG